MYVGHYITLFNYSRYYIAAHACTMCTIKGMEDEENVDHFVH